MMIGLMFFFMLGTLPSRAKPVAVSLGKCLALRLPIVASRLADNARQSALRVVLDLAEVDEEVEEVGVLSHCLAFRSLFFVMIV
jgi:hypothetical protein